MSNTGSSQATYILGIDGGGTKTVAWLAARSNASSQCDAIVVGKGSSGPSNQRAVGAMVATQNLDAAIDAAFADAGLPRATVVAAALGLAGADRNSDRNVIMEWAQHTRLAGRIEVVNDAVPLLYANGGNGCGVALIAGTGSLAWGRNSDGLVARSGGWGYLFSDEGSAFSIGRSVLQAVSRAVDGRGHHTCLVADVLASIQVSSPAEIVSVVYSNDVPRAVVAGLAVLAFTASDRGDAVAVEVIHNAATELAAMAVVTARRLELDSRLFLAMTGAVLIQNPAFQREVIAEMKAAGIQISDAIIVENAVAGAVNMANWLAETVNK